jgi:secondary thiamine-phosphate synthase enzyme
VIQENADPAVMDDLDRFFCQLVPEDRRYRHGQEGADDMPAHIKCALTATQLSIPVRAGRLDLGTWQGIFLYEHRDRPRPRRITLHLLGE